LGKPQVSSFLQESCLCCICSRDVFCILDNKTLLQPCHKHRRSSANNHYTKTNINLAGIEQRVKLAYRQFQQETSTNFTKILPLSHKSLKKLLSQDKLHPHFPFLIQKKVLQGFRLNISLNKINSGGCSIRWVHP